MNVLSISAEDVVIEEAERSRNSVVSLTIVSRSNSVVSFTKFLTIETLS